MGALLQQVDSLARLPRSRGKSPGRAKGARLASAKQAPIGVDFIDPRAFSADVRRFHRTLLRVLVELCSFRREKRGLRVKKG